MRYYIDPFGCVKNQVDAENMMARLNHSGWESSEPDEADLIIVNSCGFIESAKQESIDAVLFWRKIYPDKKILLAGCLGQRYGKELAEALPEADFLFGNRDLDGITGAAETALGRKSPQPQQREPQAAPPRAAPLAPGERPLLSLPGSAYVKISEGCDNHCSFCAIPEIRGKLQSRDRIDLVDECRALLDRGIQELCIIGQDLGSYGRDFSQARVMGADEFHSELPGLLEALSRINGKFWIRLLYIHPDHFPLPVLDIMKADHRFLPYFDLPFQHGSEKILKLMNRRGSAGIYLELINTIRQNLDDAVIRSTFMTGFPGETDEEFGALLEFQQKARLDWMGCFTFSREDGTPAYDMKGRVGKKSANERKKILEERQIPITEKQMDRFIHRDFDVLVEEKIEGEEGLYLGRLPCQAPDIDGSAVISSDKDLEIGALVQCRVFARSGLDLEVRV